MPGAPGKAPLPVLAVPVTDYKQVAEQLKLEKSDGSIAELKPPKGPAGLLAKRGGFALFAERPHREGLEKVLAAKQSIAAEMAGIEPWLAANDASFVGTRAGIALAAAEARKALAQLGPGADVEKTIVPGGPMASMRAALGFYSKILEAAEKDAALAAVGVLADNEGTIRVKSRLRFLAASRFGQSLGQIPPQRQDLLTGLPGGAFLFAFGAAVPEPLVQQVAAFFADLMKTHAADYGLTPEQAAQYAKAWNKGTQHVRSVSMVMKPGRRGEPIYSNIFAWLRVNDAAGYLDQAKEQIQALNQLAKEAPNSLMKPAEVKPIQIGGHAALELLVTIPLPKATGNGPEQQMQQAMMQVMFGPSDKVTAYEAVANPRTVVVGYGTTSERVGQVIDLLANGKAGLAGDADLAATAALLPAGAEWVGYVSPRGYVGLIQRMFREIGGAMGAGGAPLPLPTLPAFPQTPPVGGALEASAGTLDGTLVVPVAVLKAGGEYIQTIQQTMMNPAPQIP